MAESDLFMGYLLANLAPVVQVDAGLAIILGIIGGAIVIVVGILMCWDLSKQSIDDTAQVGWVILFFIVPVVSWIAYWLVIKLA